MGRQRTVTGFTLIELLVVISIIGLLAALLTVAMSTVKKVSLQTTCVNNLKQIGMGLQMYLQEESDGYLPKASGPSKGGPKDWPDALRRQLSLGEPNTTIGWDDDIRVKDEGDWGKGTVGRYKIFDCPANRHPESDASGERFDYTYNTALAHKPTGGTWQQDACRNVVVIHDHIKLAADPVNECLGIHNGQDNFLFLGGWVKQSEADGYASKSVDVEPWSPAP